MHSVLADLMCVRAWSSSSTTTMLAGAITFLLGATAAVPLTSDKALDIKLHTLSKMLSNGLSNVTKSQDAESYIHITSAQFFGSAACDVAIDPLGLGETDFADHVADKPVDGSCSRNLINTADATFVCSSPGTISVTEYEDNTNCGTPTVSPTFSNGVCGPLAGTPFYVKISYSGTVC